MQGIYRLLRFNRLIKVPQIKFLAVLLCRLLGIRHISVRLDPAIKCNLRCRMCYFANEEQKGMSLEDEEANRLLEELLPRALQFIIGCAYEPTMHKGFLRFIRMAAKHNVPYIGMTSNGQLLRKEDMEEMINCKADEITISLHGVYRETYEYMMPGASYGRHLRVLDIIDETRKDMRSEVPQLRLNYTVNSRNLDELKDFFKVYGKYNIKTLQVRPMYGSDFPDGLLSETNVMKYRQTVDSLSSECSKRGITLMANTSDERFQQDNYTSIIFPEVNYMVNPGFVWRRDFDWNKETMREFQKRIGYNTYLLKCVFSSSRKLLNRPGMEIYRSTGKYDIG
jgi:MoaA/NifB/PqqE/SkfB family radical SAM enzyme